ncbi:MAG: BREX-1 system adenine-specific DNA-methyltransferase PglX [Prolixibacteraceae bacterium]|nr:BREX-1 system adenine-specific DNA-methyltransferase PglX [Prolixibacteraceae bacterium]
MPKLIIEKNLHGFEIDERAAQLSGFALMMKALEYQRRSLRKNIKPNILCFTDLDLAADELDETLAALLPNATDELTNDLKTMQQATNYGSLIVPQSTVEQLQAAQASLNHIIAGNHLFQKEKAEALLQAIEQLIKLSQKFQCVAANPPYMGGGGMNKELAQFVKTNYPDSKSDLMACFMELGLFKLHPMGFMGMINQHSWMFLSSYEKLRIKLIENNFFDTLLHLGARTFPEIGGEVVQNAAFTFWNKPYEAKGSYIRLVDFNSSELKKEKTLEAIQNPNCGWFYTANQKDFEKIPGSPIGYWLSDIILYAFTESKLSDSFVAKAGIVTGNDNQLIRFWSEIDYSPIKFKETAYSYNENVRWVPLNKGGAYRKYYGNNFYIINIHDLWTEGKTTKSVRRGNEDYYYKNAITWSMVTSNKASFRFSHNKVFNVASPAIFSNENSLETVLTFLNSKVTEIILPALNPTLNILTGDILSLPYKLQVPKYFIIENLSKEQINISKLEWDSKETSWDFFKNELLRIKGQDLEESYDLYCQYWSNKFFQLHKNEEELNRQFIEIYGLQGELTPDVPLEDITILQDELNRKALAQLNKKLARHPETLLVSNYHELELPFLASEVMEQFISYAVGCMFGRYSLDKEGLILANQGETINDYHRIIAEGASNALPKKSPLGDLGVFGVDDDNIIPILDNEWFEDDIVGRFHQFLKVSFGDDHFAKNLAFIEDKIGMDMRRYFNREFYKDHVRRYKKRPIYWMFSSPKGAFNALIYMHRYTPDTVSNILNKYLKEFTGKLKTRYEHLQHVQVSGTVAEKTKAIKESDSIDKILTELLEYERDTLYPLATERVSIDLDDGVLVNYNKFGTAIKQVPGLNDKKAKDKVRKFDWIDTSQIR